MAKNYLDQTGLALVWAKIKELVSTKVDKVEGKGLSSNDYTSDEKTKLAGIASGAQVNVLEGIQKNGNTVTVTNKIANISVPTKTSDITNDSGYITSSSVPTATTTTPKMDGTATVGTETAFARGDHIHPSDTTRVPTSRKVNGKALSSDITLSASDVSAIPTSAKGAANGVCPLNANSVIDSAYLPSFVDDVVEAYARASQTELSSTWLAKTPESQASEPIEPDAQIVPQSGVIYVLMADSTNYSANSQFRWSGSGYVRLNDGGVSPITNEEINTICV